MFEVNFVEEDLKEIIRGLKKENKELKEKHKVACDYIEWCGRTITKLLEAEKELQEQLEKERELYYGDDDFADDDWGRE